MIVQCEECQARFRLADEKIKPGGTKVRCSKCKHVFTVSPPAPEPEPEPEVPQEPPQEVQPPPATEDQVDFGEFNMEKVDDDDAPAPQAEETPSVDAAADELDFSGLEEEMEDTAGAKGELADDFSFAETSESEEDEESSTDDEAGETDFSAAFDETDDFGLETDDETATTEPEPEPSFESEEIDFAEDASSSEETPAEATGDSPGLDEGSDEFDFGETTDETAVEETSSPEDESGDFSFGDDDSDSSFGFDEPQESAADEASDELDFSGDEGPGEFSFGDEEEEATSSEWDDDSGESTSFDFDEPQFETEASEAAEHVESDGGLQFGEIDLAGDGGGDDSPTFETESEDFSQATLAREEETETTESYQEETYRERERDDYDDEPIPTPKPKKKKSALSSILLLLVLLLLGLGGAAGYFYMEDGGLDINRIAQRFPFLQPYLGEGMVEESGEIGINIAGSSYVTNKVAGQLLVIQGEAVNKYSKPRQLVTVKGVLLDAQGKVLYQQTVFCGNPLEDKDLATMDFAKIEDEMNNDFGNLFSNMNIAPGGSIPFTIVFRNLPDNIANINVELVDSKPADG